MQPGDDLPPYIIMDKVPTSHDVIGLKNLARRLRASAADTNNMNYIGLFLSAAMALEARASGAGPDMAEFDRHLIQH